MVNPDWLLKPDASEYLVQHLVAVPSQQVKDFLKSYESVSPMVVPRSAELLAKDEEFQLFAVTVFKKHSQEFIHKAREQRWTPRDWKFHEGGREAEDEELHKLEKEERRLWGEALRLGRTGYSDAVMSWMHVLALRVFVETVLRYGLPLDFVSGMIKVSCSKQRIKTMLIGRADGYQARKEGQGQLGRSLSRTRGQCYEQRQERTACSRRFEHAAGNGGSRIGGPGLRAICLLQVSTAVDTESASPLYRGCTGSIQVHPFISRVSAQCLLLLQLFRCSFLSLRLELALLPERLCCLSCLFQLQLLTMQLLRLHVPLR